MIIIAATDDPNLAEIAVSSQARNHKIYGDVFEVFQSVIPRLGSHENLFIIAHGAFEGDEDQPVIGDQRKDFYLTAMDTYENLESIFPKNFQGKVYVDACESADHGDLVSFIEILKTVLIDHKLDCRVFGIEGASSGLIPLPSEKAWIEA